MDALSTHSNRRKNRTQGGSALVVSLCTIFVLSLIAANVLSSVSSRYNSAYRSASWNEALRTAEAGVDLTMSEVFRLIPDVRFTSAEGLGTGFSQPSLGLVAGLQISAAGLLTNGTVLSFSPPALVHGGEGGTTQQATVSLDVVPLAQALNGGAAAVLNNLGGLLNGSTPQLLRLRSTGTVYLSGGRVAAPSRLDNALWRPSLFTDRLTGQRISQPTIARQIEVLLRPVFPFEAAVASDGDLLGSDPGTVFDSFNSALPLASTNGEYDSLKRLAHGSVRANSASVALGGMVYGDVWTNGGSVAKDSHVTGTVNNAAYAPLPLVNAPTWTGSPLAPSVVTGSTILPAGLPTLPAQYRVNGISGTLRITKGLAGLGTNVDIYVNGDVTGGIELDNGVTARVYVSGSINTKASRLKNGSRRAAALQIYGVISSTSNSLEIRLTADANLIAAIYAPAHRAYFTGNNDISGSVVTSRFETSGQIQVHYDEALALNVGPLLRYEIAGWKEIVN